MTRKNKRGRERGTEAVELAFLLPMFLLVVLGLIEYGWLFYNLQAVTNAARQGARIALLPSVQGAPSRQVEAEQTIQALLSKTKVALWDYRTVGPGTEEPNMFHYDPIPGDPQGRRTVTVHVAVSTEHLHIINMNGFGLNLEPAVLGAKVTMAKELP